MAQEIDFYLRKVDHCKYLRRFLEIVYTRNCLRGTNKILEALQKEQDIMLKCEIFKSKKFKKYHIIVCKKHFGKFFIEDECDCQMTEGSFFQFGEEYWNKIFCDTGLNLGLELIKRYSRYKFSTSNFFLVY